MPLSDTAVRNAKPRTKPFKLSDGGGLHLLARLQAFRRAPAPVERRVLDTSGRSHQWGN